MQPITRNELETRAEDYDAAVARDPAVDPFCTSSTWLLPFHDAFAPQRPLWAACEGDAWLLLAEGALQSRACLEPLENMWGFASPLVGTGAAALLAAALAERPVPVVLLGLPLDRKRIAPLLRGLAPGWEVRPLEPTQRFVASLAGGLDGWLARRSAAFRRNLRAARRRVAEAGIAFERVAEAAPASTGPLYARVLRAETLGYKSAAGNGVESGAMCVFYERMWRRLVARRQLRLLFAQRDGRDVGYLHGALVRGRFRGLQFSFAESERPLGLGNVLQYEMLRWLCEEGAQVYDLGARNEYKQRWAEPGLATFGLALWPPT